MSNIKSFIKKTYFFQYKRCFDEYLRKVEFRESLDFKEKLFLASKYRIAKETDYSNEAKLNQIHKVLSKSRIEISNDNRFFYSLDESVCMYNSRTVIDNMPCDYDFFVNHSLRSMSMMGKQEVLESNRKLVEILEAYIKYAILRLTEKNKNEQAQYLEEIIESPAKDLRGALQRILFWNQLLWQTNHRLVGLGRLDKILNKFSYKEEDCVLIRDFLKILHNHYVFKSSAMPGDTGQVIILGGIEEDGNYFCNDYTYVILREIIDLKLPDPKIVLRVSANTPDDIIQLATKGIATGIGSPLLSNDNVVIPAMEKFGYRHDEATDYSVSACWEPLPSKNSIEQNNLISIDFGKVFTNVYDNPKFEKIFNMDCLFSLFQSEFENYILEILNYIDQVKWNKDPIMTLSSESCRESGKLISDGGSKNNNYGVLSVGLGTVVNSFVNIKHLVFERKKYTLSELKKAVAENYIGFDSLLKDILAEKKEYGTDSIDAIAFTNRIIDIVNNSISNYRNIFGGKLKFGLSSPSYINSGKQTRATLDGRRSGAPYSTHISNEQAKTLTEIINFASKINYCNNSCNGNVADIMLTPDIICGNMEKFVLFIRSAIRTGFFQVQFNVIRSRQLIDAKEHPENYQSLIVRVWGFSAYFNDLPDEYKEQLINRAIEMEKTELPE